LKVNKIILASPKEPCGATWLINCLLELGVMTYRDCPLALWVPFGAGFVLNRHNNHLAKWLPVLGGRRVFNFRQGIEVQWTHEWPNTSHQNLKIIYFARDSRDALFSAFKRDSLEFNFDDYVRFPDVFSLLDRIDNHRIHAESWLSLPNVTVVRFEDYKRDAVGTLRYVLSAIGVDVSDVDVERAVNSSTFEKAAAAERRYRERHPEDSRFICRSGTAGEYQNNVADKSTIQEIEDRCRPLLLRLGYPVADSGADAMGANMSFRSHLRSLSFFHPLLVSDSALGPPVVAKEYRCDLSWLEAKSADWFMCRNLSYYEYISLLRSIKELGIHPALALGRRQVWEGRKSYLDLIRTFLERPLLKRFNLSSFAMKTYFRLQALRS